MSESTPASHLAKQGIAALKAGDKDTAYQCLKQASEQAPGNQDIWLWFSDAAHDEVEQRHALEQAVRLDPSSKLGQIAQKKLSTLAAHSPSNALAMPPADHAFVYEQTAQELNVSVIESAQNTTTRVEVLQFNNLSGNDNVHIAQALFYAHHVGMRLKQIRVTLKDGEIVAEAGALHFMKGNIRVSSPMGGASGFAKKVVSNVLTQETLFRPHYRGTGEIHLEPTFGHFVIVYLNNEQVVVDKGMFYAAEGSIEVGVAVQKNLSAALFGGEGWFQTKLTGTGWCVLASPVPSNEIVRYHLHNERLQVDGHFALLRKGQIDFKVEKTTKTLLGSVASGEKLVQTFTGTGEVWVAPTQDIYRNIQQFGVANVTQAPRVQSQESGNH